MTERSLQVTYRKRRTPLASNERRARGGVASPGSLLIGDYAASGQPLGVEITALQARSGRVVGPRSARDRVLTFRSRRAVWSPACRRALARRATCQALIPTHVGGWGDLGGAMAVVAPIQSRTTNR